MKIAILDSHTANPGDIAMDAWQRIYDSDGRQCEIADYPRTRPDEIISHAADAEIIITNKVVITDIVMQQLPRLRYIGVVATGFNIVDTEAAHRRGIIVTNVPAYSTASVAQMVFAHLLNITNDVATHSQAVRNGAWTSCPDFTFRLTPQIELEGMTMGIIGYGNIGKAVTRIALAFGMHVVLAPSLSGNGKRDISLPEGVSEADTLESMLRQSDIISLHCPLTPATRHIVNTQTISMMKPTAIIINTGRGPLIDEQALANALNDGRIAAAGIDVLEEEPPISDSPLIHARNCHITPHIAWATLAARQRLMDVVVANIQAFLNGQPTNVV